MNRYIDSSLKVYFFFSVLAVASTIYAASPVDLPSGLPAPVAWWSFAGQDRITVVDRMGTTAAGTAHAGVNLVPGVVGKAVAMDGKEGVITIPDHPRLHFTGPMSLAAWVKPEQPQNEPAHSGNIVSKWYAPDSYGLSWTGSSYNLMTAFKVGGQWGHRLTFLCRQAQPMDACCRRVRWQTRGDLSQRRTRRRTGNRDGAKNHGDQGVSGSGPRAGQASGFVETDPDWRLSLSRYYQRSDAF